jgi:hypothetical protein
MPTSLLNIKYVNAMKIKDIRVSKNFSSPLYVYSDFSLKCIHTRHSYRAFIHHSVSPIILLRSNIFSLDRHNIQIREYPLGSFYSWDTI